MDIVRLYKNHARPRHRKSRPAGVAILALMLGFFALSTRSATQSVPPFPEFTGAHLILGEGVDSAPYEDLKAALDTATKPGAPAYYAVVLRTTGTGGTATQRYIDGLVAAWSLTGTKRLDPERSIVIVVGLDNRQVSVHPGTALRKTYGLDPATLDRDLVRPTFVPLARAGQYPQAIQALITAVNAAMNRHDDAQKAGQAEQARQRANQAQRLQEQNERSRRFYTRTLPFGLGATLAGGAAIGLGLVRMRQVRARKAAEDRVKAVRARATELMEQLDALKERHKLLLASDPDFKEPLQGQTLAKYVGVRDSLRGLWDRWLTVMDTLEKAQELAHKQSGLGTEKLDEACRLLEQQGQFEDMTREAESCRTDLDLLGRAHEEAAAEVKALSAEAAQLKAQLDALNQNQLAGAPYRPDQDDANRLTSQSEAVLIADPLTARQGFQQARQKVQALLERIRSVLARFQESRALVTAIENARAKIDATRAGGVRLDEADGNPDPLLEQARQAQAALLAALQRGQVETAITQRDLAASLTAGAADLVDRTVQAKEHARNDLPIREREAPKLREALKLAESYHDELQREFAPASWQPVADSLASARDLMAKSEAAIPAARAASGENAQRYLEAARLVQMIDQNQKEAQRLATGLRERLDALRKTRDEVRAGLAAVEEAARQIAQVFARNEAVVGSAARTAFHDAQLAHRELNAGAAGPRPDWPSLLDRLAQAKSGYELAAERAEADRRLHQSLLEQLDGARRKSASVAALLRGEQADRAAANDRFRAASQALEVLARHAGTPGGDWEHLLADLRQASADLDQAEQMARDDIRLGNQAIAALATAERTIRAAHAFTDMGMSADAGTAIARQNQARAALESQAYEQAIELAGIAERTAREAYDNAVARARARRDQLEAERRWRETAEAMRRSSQLPNAGVSTAGPDLFTTVAGALITAAAQQASRRGESNSPATFSAPSNPASDSSSTSWSGGDSASQSSQTSW